MAQFKSVLDVLNRAKVANGKAYSKGLYEAVTGFIEGLPISPESIKETEGGKKYQIVDFDSTDGFYADVWVWREEGDVVGSDTLGVEVEYDFGATNAKTRVKNSGEAYMALQRLKEIEFSRPHHSDKYYLFSDDHKYVNKMTDKDNLLSAEERRILDSLV